MIDVLQRSSPAVLHAYPKFLSTRKKKKSRIKNILTTYAVTKYTRANKHFDKLQSLF